mmetsp:Transcript_42744/g.65681  ORF Transcript_42744/g.65681 Transcript_42744/m.65681 type:complete len:190 (+) Transcript_42744:1763-2332(+)
MSKSPMKIAGFMGGAAGGGISQIIAAAGIGKSNLTMDNKNFRKLDRGGTAPSAKSMKSQNSRGTRMTGAMSRQSRVEEDFESMEVEEVEALIEKAERDMKMAEDAKRKIRRQKATTAQARDAKLGPIEASLIQIRKRITMLYQIKDLKIPFYEKLPKDHQFYIHFMQNLEYQRIREAARQKVDQNRNLF